MLHNQSFESILQIFERGAVFKRNDCRKYSRRIYRTQTRHPWADFLLPGTIPNRAGSSFSVDFLIGIPDRKYTNANIYINHVL